MIRTELGGHAEHLLAYAGTAFLLLRAYGPKRWLGITAGLTAYAGVLELLQHLSPGRTPALIDFAFSASGVLLGLVLFATTIRTVSRNRTRR
jgi:VanZ family protein